MIFWKKIVCVFLMLLAAGLCKDGWERGMHAHFQKQGWLPERLEISQREKIGQTCSAVALGGLRSMVASFINLRAYGSFQNSDWVKLEDEFGTMVALQPKNNYYWDTGAWHLAYNAATWHQENEEAPEVRRRAMHKEYVLKGRSFLERGLKNNPNDWTLLSSLGRFYSTSTKYPDYSKAADAYRKAFETGKARGYEGRAWLYSLARAEDRRDEALALARRLFENPRNRVDSLLCLLFAMESAPVDAPPANELLKRIFPSDKEALEMLSLYQQNNIDNMPQDGVEYAIQLLKTRVGIEPPPVLRKPE